jgi:hypothetical protein
MVQNILTILKIGALLAIIVFGVLFGKGDTAHFTPLFDWQKISFSVFAAAFIPVIFAYSGWNAITYIAGEVKDPEKNLPRALLFGVLIVTALYLAINAVYIYAVPVTEMKGALRVSEVATTALFGYQTSALITAIITISILGALNAVTMIGPRIYYAMAQDGVLFKSLSRVHPRFGTPSSAIILQDKYLGNLVYLRECGHHVILGDHRRLSHRASLQKAGAQASLQGLGLSDRAAAICAHTFMDRLGIGNRETVRVAGGRCHCCGRHSNLFYLEDSRSGAKAEFCFEIVRQKFKPLVPEQRELLANGNPYHPSLYQDRR